jgi:hypothetical protein
LTRSSTASSSTRASSPRTRRGRSADYHPGGARVARWLAPAAVPPHERRSREVLY